MTDKHAVKSQPELYTTHAASFTSVSTDRENGLEDNDSSRARFVFLQFPQPRLVGAVRCGAVRSGPVRSGRSGAGHTILGHLH